MSVIKTAVSILADLFTQADAAAREAGVSRSEFFALALAEYLRRRESRNLLDRLNRVYGAPPDAEEKALAKSRRAAHRRLLQGGW